MRRLTAREFWRFTATSRDLSYAPGWTLRTRGPVTIRWSAKTPAPKMPWMYRIRHA